MTPLISLNNPRMAQAYIDYMAIKGVRCQLNKVGTDYQIQLLDLQHQPLAEQELQRFLAEPEHQRYQQASWQRLDSQPPVFKYASSSKLLLSNFLSHSGPVTISVFLIAAIIYLFFILGLGNHLYQYLLFPQPFSLSEPWRLLTPVLLHFSALHILFNLIWWWYLGGMIEQKLSGAGLFTLLLISGLVSNFSQYLATDAYFGGLSGVVYALMGFIWWSRLFKPERGLFLPTPYVNFMLVWLVIGFFQPLGMNIANTAHLSGLLAGCLLALLPLEKLTR